MRLHHVPTRETQRIKIIDGRTHHQTFWIFAGGNPDGGGFGLTADYEIAEALKQLRQMSCGCPNKPDLCSAFSDGVGPLAFMTIIDERRQNNRQISVGNLICSTDHDFMAGAGKDCGEVANMNARQVLQHSPHILFKSSRKGMPLKTRAIASGNSILINIASPAF